MSTAVIFLNNKLFIGPWKVLGYVYDIISIGIEVSEILKDINSLLKPKILQKYYYLFWGKTFLILGSLLGEVCVSVIE